MHVWPLRTVALTAALACAACQPNVQQRATDAKATIERYCTDCHNDAERTGDLTLQRVSLTEVAAHTDMWEKVVRKLRGGMMPPRSLRTTFSHMPVCAATSVSETRCSVRSPVRSASLWQSVQ